jgi:phenylacetate-CoA ligase
MSWLHTHIVMPLIEPDRCAGLPGRLRSIRRFERMPEKAQREEQQARLQRLLQHAYHTVPFYRQQFDKAGFRPSDARVDRPLPLPILTRDQLRTASYSLRSNAYKPDSRRVAASSGATSAPIRFHRDVEAVRDKVALKLHLDSWAGFDAGDSVMMLWGANCGPRRESNWRWRTYEGVFMRQAPLPAGGMGLDVLERLRWRFEKQRPQVLYGLSSVLAAFAAYCQERGIRHLPHAIVAAGEVLTGPDRRLLESVFHTIPFLTYGRRDVGMIAGECAEHEGLHFHPWGSYVEFEPIGESRNGMVHRLLVTDLLNYGQPFIRYDTGDCVTLAPQKCSCGSWFPLVDQVVGRFVDGVVRPNGTVVPITELRNRTTSPKRSFQSLAPLRIERRSPATRGSRDDFRNRGLSA